MSEYLNLLVPLVTKEHSSKQQDPYFSPYQCILELHRMILFVARDVLNADQWNAVPSNITLPIKVTVCSLFTKKEKGKNTTLNFQNKWR